MKLYRNNNKKVRKLMNSNVDSEAIRAARIALKHGKLLSFLNRNASFVKKIYASSGVNGLKLNVCQIFFKCLINV